MLIHWTPADVLLNIFFINVFGSQFFFSLLRCLESFTSASSSTAVLFSCAFAKRLQYYLFSCWFHFSKHFFSLKHLVCCSFQIGFFLLCIQKNCIVFFLSHFICSVYCARIFIFFTETVNISQLFSYQNEGQWLGLMCNQIKVDKYRHVNFSRKNHEKRVFFNAQNDYA